MAPLVAAALISAGSSLVSGLMSGAGKAQDLKKYQADKAAQETEWKNRLAGYNTAMKPTTPYYQTQNMPGLDRLLTQTVMGNLKNRLGANLASYGIDLNDISNSMGLNQPLTQPQPTNPSYMPGAGGGGGNPKIIQDRLSQQYGLGEPVPVR